MISPTYSLSAAVLAAALCGCGGGDDPGATSSQTGQSPAAAEAAFLAPLTAVAPVTEPDRERATPQSSPRDTDGAATPRSLED